MVLTAHLSQDRTLRLGCLPVLLSGPPPPPISPAPFLEGTVLSPKPAPSGTLVPSPAQAVLTSSQVPRDEAEEDADDVTQVRCAALLALLQPQGRVPSWARGLPAPRHPGTWSRDPLFCPARQPLCPLSSSPAAGWNVSSSHIHSQTTLLIQVHSPRSCSGLLQPGQYMLTFPCWGWG